MIVAVGNDSQYRAYCEAIGRAELGTDARFATNSQRIVNRDALIPELEAVMRTRPRDTWLAALAEAGVPSGPINDIARCSPTRTWCIAARRARWRTRWPARRPRWPARCACRPPRWNTVAPPLLGEDTDAVLAEWLGIDGAGVARLREEGTLR